MSRALKVAHHKRRLRVHYLRWRSEGGDLDCGLSLARTIRADRFAKHERGCVKHASALRQLGETVPPVPGESDFN